MPPKPGKMPSSTSGSPICVRGSSLAMRESQASASSVPPPRHTPSIAATVGQRQRREPAERGVRAAHDQRQHLRADR